MTPPPAAKRSKPKPKTRRRKPKAPPPPVFSRPVAGALLLLRVWTGGVFLVTAWWKLVQDGWTLGEKIEHFREFEYVPMLERAIRYPPEIFSTPLTLYADFLEHVMLPFADVAAPAILVFEAWLGITLILGLGVRWHAALGVVLMLAFNLAKVVGGWEPPEPVGVYLFTVRTANWPLTFVLLLLSVAAAGRILGLDAWIRARGPRWLRWTA